MPTRNIWQRSFKAQVGRTIGNSTNILSKEDYDYSKIKSSSPKAQDNLDNNDDERTVHYLNSEWLVSLTTWIGDSSNARTKQRIFNVVIQFDPLTTTSPKNPNGFGPLYFEGVLEEDIESMLNAPSPGHEYLYKWSFVFGDKVGRIMDLRKANLAKRQERIDLKKELKDLENEEEKDKVEGEKHDQTLSNNIVNSLDKSSNEEEIDKINKKLEQNAKDINVLKEETKIAKKIAEGKADKELISKNILRQLEGIFGVNLDKRAFFGILRSMTGGAINPNLWFQLKGMYNKFTDLVSKEGPKFGSIAQKLFNTYNPIFKGEGGRYRLEMYNTLKGRVRAHHKRKDIATEFFKQNEHLFDIDNLSWNFSLKKGEGKQILKDVKNKNIKEVFVRQIDPATGKALMNSNGKYVYTKVIRRVNVVEKTSSKSLVAFRTAKRSVKILEAADPIFLVAGVTLSVTRHVRKKQKIERAKQTGNYKLAKNKQTIKSKYKQMGKK